MPLVRLPDGRTARFPDDMPREQIKGIIAEKFPEAAAPSAPKSETPVDAVRQPTDEFGQDIPLALPGTEAPAKPQESYDDSYFAQGTSGVNEGIATVLGAPVDIANLGLRAGAAGLNALTGSNIDLPVNALGGRQTFVDAMGPSIKPESTDPSKRIVRRVGEEVGASLVPGGAVAGRAARPLRTLAAQTTTAIGSGTAAAVAREAVPDNPYVEMAAQILGGGSVALAGKGMRKLASPFEINPERAAMNRVMADEGVDLSAGQQTGSKGLKYAESELGGGAVADLNELQAEQFTSATLSRIGVRASRATPEVMRDANAAIGKQFDDLAVRNYVSPDGQLSTDLADVVGEYNAMVNESQRAPIIENTLRDIIKAVKTGPVPGAAGQNALTIGPVPGVITGEAYKALTSRLARKARGTPDPELKEALYGIRSALDDAMERTIQKVNPGDMSAWQQARSDYKNFLVIEDAVGRAGEAAAGGIITPAALRGAVAKQGKRAYTQGKGDMSELARAGVGTMSPLPQSGTAPRNAVRNLGAGLPAALGAGVGGAAGNLPGAALGFVAGAAFPYALGRLVLSKAGRNYLTNQKFTRSISLKDAVSGPALAAPATLGANQQEQNALRATPPG
jgi:hypothetical protein